MRRLAMPVCVALAGASLAVAPAGATHQTSPPPIAPKSFVQCTSGSQETFSVPTRHGAIFVRLTRPSGAAGVCNRSPVILTLTPYSILGSSSADSFYVRRGYVRAVADVLGTGHSGGCWDYGGQREQESAYDLVEWLGTRPWSNGKVGMIGASYDGTTANMAAAANPPHLAAIVPEVAISDWYGYAYGDGVRYGTADPGQRQGLVIDEQGLDTPLTFDLAYSMVPANDRANLPADARWAERACPGLDKVFHTQRGYDLNPDKDAFWAARDYVAHAAALAEPDGLEIPVLVAGGWRDWNVKRSESVRWFDAIPVDDPHTPEDEGVPYKMLVMGSGAHGLPDVDNWATIVHAWWDRWLMDLDTGIDRQPASISRGNDGVVRTDWTWPPPTTEDVRLTLHPGGTLGTAAPGATDAGRTFFDTGRMTESEALRLRGGPEMLWYESAPLATDLRIAGLPRLDLHAATLGTSTHFTPVLFDLGPTPVPSSAPCQFQPAQDACMISRGFLNARYRDGLAQGADLTPGAPYRAVVRFHDADYVVKAGHRIGVAVMSSNAWWAVPDPQRASTTIYADAARPSALLLPVVGGGGVAANAGL